VAGSLYPVVPIIGKEVRVGRRTVSYGLMRFAKIAPQRERVCRSWISHMLYASVVIQWLPGPDRRRFALIVYVNKRAEMWGATRAWLAGGSDDR
jgi:hypothetical protein